MSYTTAMKVKTENGRLNIRSTPEVIGFLDQLAEIGIHGKTRSEVAKTLISNEIERLVREGILVLQNSQMVR